ncbi:MAG: hypothetical protein QOK02_2092 [Mycobacterium sp.]|nr:hypothetical protein [Mycobacterium sp.]
MLFAITLFLLVLSPLFIPIGVTVVYEFGDWRDAIVARLSRPARQYRPAIGLLPAAA